MSWDDYTYLGLLTPYLNRYRFVSTFTLSENTVRLIRIEAKSARAAIRDLLDGNAPSGEHPLVLSGWLDAQSWIACQNGRRREAIKFARERDALLIRFMHPSALSSLEHMGLVLDNSPGRR